LIKHSFPFGGAISARQVIENPVAYQNFKKAFNHVVLENDLKIKSWQWEKKRTRTLKALEMLNNDGYLVKGHVLIWPGFNYLTKEFKENKNNPKKVTKIIHNHLKNILEATNGKVSHWDVVNEAYTNKDLQKITGSEEILFDGFRILKKKNPKLGAFTNEYGIISKGGLDTRKQQWYYNFVKRIDSVTNGLINGIGLQSHIGSDLTPPQKVLEILGFYATLGKQISISEFTMDIQDATIREQYTRDFMIAAFSHPNVSEFIFWGCIKDERNKVDIYNQDFTVGAMGKAYFSLINKDWKTQFTQQTNHKGILKNRGFYGTYKYSFTNSEGDIVSGTFFLNPKNKNTIHIDLK
jgi:GH35 family endo-1,4-beta-xylanase